MHAPRLRRLRIVHLDHEEQRRLALLDPLEQLGVSGVPRGQLGKTIAEVEQQGEPVTSRQGCEVLGDLIQGRRKRNGSLARGHVAPTSMGTRTALPHSVHEPS